MRNKKKLVGFAAAALLLVSGVAFADLYEVTGKKVVVRRGPSSQEPAVASVEKGRVLDGTMMGPWLRTEYADKSGHGYVYYTLVKPAKDGAVAESIQVHVPPVKEMAVVVSPDVPVADPKAQAVSPDPAKPAIAMTVGATSGTASIDKVSSVVAGSLGKATVANRTKLRKSPGGPAYRYLGKGETVEVVSVEGKWSKVVSQWKFDSGKAMDGVVFTADLEGGQKDVSAPISTPPAKTPEIPVVIKSVPPVVYGGPAPAVSKSPARVVQVASLKSHDEDLKAATASRDALSAKLKDSQAESERLKSQVAKSESDLSSIKAALASTSARLKAADDDRSRLFAENKAALTELELVKKQLMAFTDNGRGRYLAMADNGEAVFFKGVGEAQMAALENKTVLRFPLSLAGKADKLLVGAKAARHLQGAFVYYIMDTNQLVF